MLRVVVGFCLLSCVLSQLTFEGVWTDSKYGGQTFVCVDGDTLWAAYSHVGIAVGTVDGTTAYGDWYEVGGEIRPATSVTGSFRWTLTDNGQSWTGRLNTPTSQVTGTWNEQRISDDVPSARDCARLAASSVFGRWSNNRLTWDLCADGEDKYVSSFNNTESASGGFSNGLSFNQGQIASGYFIDGQDHAYSLSFPLSDGRMGVFLYYVQTLGQRIDVDGYDVFSFYDTLSVAGRTNDLSCRRNDADSSLLEYYGYLLYSDYGVTSSAQVLSGLLCLICLTSFLLI